MHCLQCGILLNEINQSQTRPHCKSCVNMESRKVWEETRDTSLDKQRARRAKLKAKDQFSWFIQSKRKECKSNSTEFNLTVEYVKELWDGKCSISGNDIFFDVKQTDPNRANLDRVDNSKGYVIGNVAWCGHRLNRIKSSATLKDIREILKYMEDRIHE